MQGVLVRTLACLISCLISDAALGQGICPVDLPEPINLAKKRSDMIAAYPPLPDPVTLDSLRKQGSKHRDFEVSIIGGWRAEIEGRCQSVKETEAKAAKMKTRGDITDNQLADCAEAIRDERLRCDVKNRKTSPYYTLLREVESYNNEKFEELKTAFYECSRNNECNR